MTHPLPFLNRVLSEFRNGEFLRSSSPDHLKELFHALNECGIHCAFLEKCVTFKMDVPDGLEVLGPSAFRETLNALKIND